MSKKILQDQRGITFIIEVLIVVAIATALGAVYVKTQNARQEAAKKQQEQASKPVTDQPSVQADVTLNWTGFASASGHFSLRYNPKWKTRTCSDQPTMLMLAADDASLGVCNSGKVSQITITSDPFQVQNYQSVETLTQKVTADVTVSGVSGQRVSGIDIGTAATAKGTVWIKYTFNSGGRTYRLNYAQAPGQADISSDFELMVKNTLKFN